MQLLSAKIFIVIIASAVNFVDSVCVTSSMGTRDFVDFELDCNKSDELEIICDSDDWSKFSDVSLDLSTSGLQISFRNCNFPADLSVQSILQSMKINAYSKIIFHESQSTPNRQNLKGLTVSELHIRRSNFSELPFDLFYDVLDLRTLRIWHSTVNYLPAYFFSDWAENLTTVDLSRNELKKIARNDLNRLVNATQLDLSSNQIEEIEPGAFDSLARLEILRLSENNLPSLPPGIFHRTIRLTEVNLNDNWFEELPGDLFANSKKLTQIFMMYSNLTFLPRGFFKNLGRLERVFLKESPLQSLPADLFAGCSRLSYILLSRHQLRTLPLGLFDDTKNLKILQIDNNQLESLPAGIFKGLDRLEQLNIAGNRFTSLMSDVLKDLQSVGRFDASHNSLTRIDDRFIFYLKSATTIDLSYNQLAFENRVKFKSQHQNASSSMMAFRESNSTRTSEKKISAQLNFDPSIKLKGINLSNNNIAQVDSDLMGMLPYCESIDLRYNRISKINLSELSGDDTTGGHVTVDLANNPYHCDCALRDFVRYLKGWRLYEHQYTFPAGHMRCASPSEFEKRRIGDIPIENLNCSLKTSDPPDACEKTCTCRKNGQRQVFSVDCSHRNLAKVPRVIVNKPNWPLELNMSGNALQEAPSLGYSYLAKVTSLDLSNNNISKVTQDLFSSKLQRLKLHGNGISHLDSNVIEHLSRSNTLHSITLHDNRWACDCETRRFLSSMLSKRTIYGFREIRCYETNQKPRKITSREACDQDFNQQK